MGGWSEICQISFKTSHFCSYAYLWKFYTLLTQVEACLNSRPLVTVGDDVSDIQPLTPAHFFINSPSHSTTQSCLQLNDIVLLTDENNPPAKWPLARLTEVYPANDDQVRVVKLRTSTNELDRSVSRLISLSKTSCKNAVWLTHYTEYFLYSSLVVDTLYLVNIMVMIYCIVLRYQSFSERNWSGWKIRIYN